MRKTDLAIWKKARAYLDVRSNDEHTLYSYSLAKQLLQFEKDADADIVLHAVILHDTGWKMIPKDKILQAFGPNQKYPELQRQHELESVEIANDILTGLGFGRSHIDAVTAIIDGHDTVYERRSLNDALMKDSDKLWRYTAHGIRIISGWFEMEKKEFLEVLVKFVRPRLLLPVSGVIADSLVAIAALEGSEKEKVAMPQ